MSKERNEALARMTKAELIRTIKALDKRQTQLLNECGRWKTAHDKLAGVAAGLLDKPAPDQSGNGNENLRAPLFPWEAKMPNAFGGE